MPQDFLRFDVDTLRSNHLDTRSRWVSLSKSCLASELEMCKALVSSTMAMSRVRAHDASWTTPSILQMMDACDRALLAFSNGKHLLCLQSIEPHGVQCMKSFCFFCCKVLAARRMHIQHFRDLATSKPNSDSLAPHAQVTALLKEVAAFLQAEGSWILASPFGGGLTPPDLAGGKRAIAPEWLHELALSDMDKLFTVDLLAMDMRERNEAFDPHKTATFADFLSKLGIHCCCEFDGNSVAKSCQFFPRSPDPSVDWEAAIKELETTGGNGNVDTILKSLRPLCLAAKPNTKHAAFSLGEGEGTAHCSVLSMLNAMTSASIFGAFVWTSWLAKENQESALVSDVCQKALSACIGAQTAMDEHDPKFDKLHKLYTDCNGWSEGDIAVASMLLPVLSAWPVFKKDVAGLTAVLGKRVYIRANKLAHAPMEELKKMYPNDYLSFVLKASRDEEKCVSSIGKNKSHIHIAPTIKKLDQHKLSIKSVLDVAPGVQPILQEIEENAGIY